MAVLRDISVDDHLIDKTKRRFDHFIPNYLEKLIKRSDAVVSIGCGLAYDVQLLCSKGYDAYGFDPGSRTEAWNRYPAELKGRLKVARAEDMPFGHDRFDFAYALEVIEHVGCEEGIWKLLPDAREIRLRFVESCLDMLKPGGRLFLSTSNRACFLDVGHTHHYTRITDLMGRKLHLPLTVPWHRKNFVWSFGDVSRLLAASKYRGKVVAEAVSTAGYPARARHVERSRWRERLAGRFLEMVNVPLLRTSFLNPILAVSIRKTVAGEVPYVAPILHDAAQVA
jgi:SAM-dependent methyltransferase